MFYLPNAAIDTLKLFALGTFSFLLAFWLTPFLTRILYKYKLWRKTVRTKAVDGKDLTYFQKFHSEGETHTPRFGGLLIWMVPCLLAGFLYLLAKADTGIWWVHKLTFIDRGQTWLPFFALISGSVTSGETSATLDTSAGADNVTNGNWTGNTAGFVVENL